MKILYAAIDQSVPDAHGGSVHVQSNQGIGTRVSLHFPTVAKPVAEAQTVMS